MRAAICEIFMYDEVTFTRSRKNLNFVLKNVLRVDSIFKPEIELKRSSRTTAIFSILALINCLHRRMHPRTKNDVGKCIEVLRSDEQRTSGFLHTFIARSRRPSTQMAPGFGGKPSNASCREVRLKIMTIAIKERRSLGISKTEALQSVHFRSLDPSNKPKSPTSSPPSTAKSKASPPRSPRPKPSSAGCSSRCLCRTFSRSHWV